MTKVPSSSKTLDFSKNRICEFDFSQSPISVYMYFLTVVVPECNKMKRTWCRSMSISFDCSSTRMLAFTCSLRNEFSVSFTSTSISFLCATVVVWLWRRVGSWSIAQSPVKHKPNKGRRVVRAYSECYAECAEGIAPGENKHKREEHVYHAKLTYTTLTHVKLTHVKLILP
jgi:hypothetical protein